MRVCEHGCDITRILIGYVLSDQRFDWLVGNMSVYPELRNFKQNQHFPSFVKLFFENYFVKAIDEFLPCLHSLI